MTPQLIGWLMMAPGIIAVLWIAAGDLRTTAYTVLIVAMVVIFVIGAMLVSGR